MGQVTTAPCPRLRRARQPPLTWRTHDRDGRLVVTVSMPPINRRCPPKETR